MRPRIRWVVVLWLCAAMAAAQAPPPSAPAPVKQPGVALVYFERSGCFGRAVVYQPLREWEGEKSLWEIGVIRSRTDGPHECLAEQPLEIER